MKKLILMTMISISLFSCKKEDCKPNEPNEPIKDCNCGVVIYANNSSTSMSAYKGVRNHCSGNMKTFPIYSSSGWLPQAELKEMEGQEHCSNQSW